MGKAWLCPQLHASYFHPDFKLHSLHSPPPPILCLTDYCLFNFCSLYFPLGLKTNPHSMYGGTMALPSHLPHPFPLSSVAARSSLLHRPFSLDQRLEALRHIFSCSGLKGSCPPVPHTDGQTLHPILESAGETLKPSLS